MPDSLDNNLFILLLSSYGSPFSFALPPQTGSSLVVLSPQCRISIRPLLHMNPLIGPFFTRKEFDYTLRRYSQNFVSSDQPFFCQRMLVITFGNVPMGTLVQSDFA